MVKLTKRFMEYCCTPEELKRLRKLRKADPVYQDSWNRAMKQLAVDLNL